MEEILEGCLRVGARVQTESRVVGFAGFWPGTPGGGPGSPGPPGKPGKMALCCPHLEDFTLVPRERNLEAGPCRPLPPSAAGYTSLRGEPGYRTG